VLSAGFHFIYLLFFIDVAPGSVIAPEAIYLFYTNLEGRSHKAKNKKKKTRPRGIKPQGRMMIFSQQLL